MSPTRNAVTRDDIYLVCLRRRAESRRTGERPLARRGSVHRVPAQRPSACERTRSGIAVVSPDKQTLYVVAWHDDGPAGFAYRLHALNLQNGTHRRAPVVIGVASSDPSNPCTPQSGFNPCVHKQRAALLLNNGVIYIGFGGDGNRGSLFAFDAQTLAQRAVWNSTPNGTNGGIWQSGQGPAADASGNIYVITGNGTFDTSNAGRQNFGNSFVKLTLEGSNLVVKDFFTPCNQAFLNRIDLDLGSGWPLLVPDTPPRIVSGGREGVCMVATTGMGGFVADPNDLIAAIQMWFNRLPRSIRSCTVRRRITAASTDRRCSGRDPTPDASRGARTTR